MSPRSLLLLLALAAAPAAAHPPTAIQADELHLGDGRVLSPGVVLVRDGRIQALGRAGAVSVPADAELRRAAAVLPGLVAGHSPRPGPDAPSIAPERLALDLVDRFADRGPWLEAGITAVAVSPGSERLVSGRGGVLRLAQELADRDHLAEGPLHAVLRPSAHSPPRVFDPNTPVNVDEPLDLARAQRPESPAAAIAELRAALEAGEGAFGQVRAGRTPLVVHAELEDEIRSALELVEGSGIRLVVHGGTESWKLAEELAAARASVVLTGANAGLGAPDPALGDWRPDVAARLSAAGVPTALGVEAGGDSPLLAAAAAVRAGLPAAEALAAVTGRAAAAAGAPELGRLQAGGPADLVLFDAPPLALHARPSLVMVAGQVRHEVAAAAEPSVLVLRAGRLRSAEGSVAEASLVISGGEVAGIETGSAVPAGADLRDYGPEAVIVPGFLDAFALVGIEPGPPAGAGSRVRAAEAVELDHPSLGRGLAAGVTSALAAPWTGGPFRGRAELVSLAPLPADEEADRRRAELERLAPAKAPFVFWLDGGPADEGARSGRLRALQGLLRKAKAYHDRWEALEKKDEKQADSKKKKARGGSEERVRLSDPRNRPGGRGGGAAEAPGGRRGAAGGEREEPPEKDPELEPWRDLFRGKVKAWLRAGRHDSIREGLGAFRSVGLKPVLLGGEEADVVAEELAEAEVPVVLQPTLARRADGEERLVAAALRRAGVSVAFGSQGLGNSDRLPLLAAAAVRGGLSASDALRALTLDAAAITEAPDGLGRLAAGDRADCVVWSGDPFEPASRVLAVVVRGRLVHEWGDDLSGLGQ